MKIPAATSPSGKVMTGRVAGLGRAVWSCGMLGLLALCATATAEMAREPMLPPNPPIRVLLMDSTSVCAMKPGGAWQVRNSAGQNVAALRAGEETTWSLSGGRIMLERRAPPTRRRPEPRPSEIDLGAGPLTVAPIAAGTTISIRNVPYGVGWWWETAEDRVYVGTLELRPTAEGRLGVVLELPVEEYLRGVVPSEIGGDSPHEALCAQAVAARSAAVLALTTSIYRGPHHDICSDVACQAFSGVTKATSATDAAVRATRGEILAFENRPVSAYYASNCGGCSEDIRNVWPERADDRAYWDTAWQDGETTAPPHLSNEAAMRRWIESPPAVWCNPEHGQVPGWAAKNFRWKREFSAAEMSARAALLDPGLGEIRELRPVKRGVSGRLIEAELVGTGGTRRVGPELAIRQIFHPPLRSAAFVVDVQTGAGDSPSTFTIRGGGWGHGVGMCQSGAVARARAGQGYRQILRHYYPRASVARAYHFRDIGAR